MKVVFSLFTALLILSSCKTKDADSMIPFIAGYWEIKSVEMGDGSVKEFSLNTSVDYIDIKGDSGVRKKLMPRLDGTFREFPTTERFQLLIRNDSLLMQYQTPYASWTEVVLEASDSLLIVKNQARNEYIYKRYKKPDVVR